MAKEQIKFTEEEMKEVNDLRVESSAVFHKLGQLSIEKANRLKELQTAEDELTSRHAELVEIEQNLYKKLNGKYGDGNYDPETGTFTPVETPQPQPEPVK